MKKIFDCDLLKNWFLREKRDLPWRVNPTPYAVWVSEVMLQQTRVSVVIPYFELWMKRFPTIQHLAEAEEDEVIKLWEGLGYYSRVRNLHAGARFIMKHFSGTLPDNAPDLAKIKGLGDYTIGAILSFAFHKRIPAVDGNVIRVLSRYLLIEEDIAKASTIRNIRSKAENLLPQDEHWIVNEALIELGATVCQRIPKCGECPIRRSCGAYAQGKSKILPIKSTKTKTITLFRTVAVIFSCNQFLVRKIKAGEIMAGLHEFPFFEAEQGLTIEDLLQSVTLKFGLKVQLAKSLEAAQHSFTCYRVHLRPHLLHCSEPKPIDGYLWMDRDQLGKAAFSSGHRKILGNLCH